MATALNITGIVSVGGTYTGPTLLNSPVHRINHQLGQLSVGYGTGTGQATRLYDAKQTSGALSSNITIGVGGAEFDIFEDAVALTSVKMIVFANQSATDSATLAGNFVTSQLGSITGLTLPVGGSLTFINPAGYTVGGSSNTINHVRDGSTNVAWRLQIVGVS